jgi:hypothetical protein
LVRWEVRKQARSGPLVLFGTKIVSKREHDAGDTDDCNIVEDAVERQGWARRSLLRHRVFIKQSHAIRSTTGKHRIRFDFGNMLLTN